MRGASAKKCSFIFIERERERGRAICQQNDVGVQVYETQHTYHVTLSQIRVYQAHAS